MSSPILLGRRSGLGCCLFFAALTACAALQFAGGPTAVKSAEPSEQATTAPGPPDPTSRRNEEYLRLFQLFADVFDQVDRNYVKDVDRRRLMEGAVRGMLSELDPYSGYISPQQLQSFKTGVESEFGGIGVQVSVEKGLLVVISPVVGSPAYRAGLMAGDQILEIDHQSTEGITLDVAIRRLQGKVGEQVTMKVKHTETNAAETLSLRREMIRMETVLGDVRLPSDQWKWMYDEEKKLGYLRITAFGRHTAEELKKALEELTQQQVRGVVLDLRFNPGGLLSAAIEVSDLFIARGRIVSTEGRNVKAKVWEATQPGTFAGFPMAVLVNRFSASASEIVAACLQDHGRAVIIGERTWGKGSVQNVVDLEGGGSLLKLTTADYRRPNGKNIHRFPDASEKDVWGVTPNDGFQVAVSRAESAQWTTLRREKDIVRKPGDTPPSAAPATTPFVDRPFQKALEYLSQQLPPTSADTSVAAKPEPPAQAP
jgi:carboxyl-terminal processing protease